MTSRALAIYVADDGHHRKVSLLYLATPGEYILADLDNEHERIVWMTDRPESTMLRVVAASWEERVLVPRSNHLDGGSVLGAWLDVRHRAADDALALARRIRDHVGNEHG